MENRPRGIKHLNLTPLEPRNYERYLPTAFDDSLTLVQKVNKVILYLHEYSKLTDDMLLKWNEVYRWIMNEGLDEAIYDRLMEWYRDGRFEEILERLLLNEYARKDWVEEILKEYDKKIEELEKTVNKTLEEFDKNINKKLEDFEKLINDLLDNTLTRKDLTLTVGNNGDFSTITGAIDSIVKMPIYPTRATIRILSDYVMDEQVLITDLDLGFVTIEANRTIEVKLSNKKFERNLNTNHGDRVIPMFYGENSIMPTFDFKLKYVSDNLPSADKKYLCGCILDNSSLVIKEGNGFTHFGYIGLGAYFNSSVVGHKCDYSWNGNRRDLDNNSHKDDTWGFGLVASHNSKYTGKGCIADNCGDSGFIAFRVSSIYIDESRAHNCGHHALVVYSSSTCSARKGIFTNSIDDNVVIGDSSLATLKLADCSGAIQHHGLIVNLGSRVDFEHGKANNCGTNGIEVQFNSTMFGRYAESSDNGMHGLFVRSNSMALFSEGQARRNGSKGVNVRKGSHVDLDRAIVKNNVLGVHSDGATVSASGTTMSENTRDGLLVSNGGIFQGNNNSIVLNKRHGVKCEDGQIDSRDSRIVDSGEDGIHATVGADVNMPRVSIRGSGNRSVNTSNAKVNISEGECINSSIGHTMIKNGSELIAYNTSFSGGSARDLNINDGGRIVANGSNGSTNATPNNITQRGYIIM